MSAKVTFTIEAGKNTTVYQAEFQRSPSATRIKEKNDSGEVTKDILFRDGKQKAIIGASDGKTNNRYLSAVIANESELKSDMDPWM